MHLYSVNSNPKVIKDMTLKIYVIARSNVPYKIQVSEEDA